MATDDNRASGTAASAHDSDSSGDEHPPAARVSWIYALKKDELVVELSKFKLSTKGTMPNLRARLVRFIREGPPKKLTAPTPPPLPVPTPPLSPVPGTSSTPYPTRVPPNNTGTIPCNISQSSRGEVSKTVRQWRLQFNGKSDAEEFLEKLYDLQENSDITTTDLLPALYEVFQGNALAWYRNNRSLWRSWTDFITDFQQFYLPADYHEALEEQIFNRRQRPGEPGRDYIVALQTLTRRHGDFTQEKVLHRVYNNLLPEYRQYIRRSDLRDIRDLVARVDEFEKLRAEMKHQVAVSPNLPPIPDRRRSAPPLLTRYNRPAVGMREVLPDTAGVPSHPRRTLPYRYEPEHRHRDREAPPETAGAPSSSRRAITSGAHEEGSPHEPLHTDPNHLVSENLQHPVPRRTYGEVVRQGPARTRLPLPNRPIICFRCGQAGHYRDECRETPRLFCSRCGKNGVMSRDCRCHTPEN